MKVGLETRLFQQPRAKWIFAIPPKYTDSSLRERPDWIILAAAFTDVDGSEKSPELAFSINRDGTKNVATAARETGAKLLYLSTDYVFDGLCDRPYEPTDPIRPLSVYGASKAAGEQTIQECAGHWLIARTSWLFGAARPCFPEKILYAAETQSELKVVNDQIGSPTYTKDLASAIRKLVRLDARGILNITNSGACSWFDFASEVLRKAGRSTSISPISTSETQPPRQAPCLLRSFSGRLGRLWRFPQELAKGVGRLSPRPSREGQTSLGILHPISDNSSCHRGSNIGFPQFVSPS